MRSVQWVMEETNIKNNTPVNPEPKETSVSGIETNTVSSKVQNDSVKKNNKKVIIAAIAIVAVMFIGGMGVLAFTFYKAYDVVKEDFNDNGSVKVIVPEDTPEVTYEYEQVVDEGEEFNDLGELPTPPSGMEWVNCDYAKAYLLKPTSWYTYEEAIEDGEACYVSAENIEYGDGTFSTGLSLNMYDNTTEVKGMSNVDYAEAFISVIADEYDSTVESAGDGVIFNGYATGVALDGDNGSTINAYYLALASTQSDRLFLIWFEGPASDWDNTWELGKTILMNLALEAE